MAKKQYQKLKDVYNITIEKRRKEQFEITIIGTNQNGTEVKVSAMADDYFLKWMSDAIVKIAKKKRDDAIIFANEIKNNVAQVL